MSRLPSERRGDKLGVPRAGRVSLGRLDVAVIHPLMQRPHGYARGRRRRPERVPQIVVL